MNLFLDICCGTFWSLTYLAAIALGCRNRTWCIPKISICMNFSWELLVIIRRLLSGAVHGIGFWIQLIWSILDLGIILTWQIFQQQMKGTRTKDILLFVCIFLAVFVVAFWWNCWKLSVFLINLIMSTEFIVRIRRNNGANWASLFIGVTKLLGTFAATLLNGLVHWNPLVLWLGGLCFILDGFYITFFTSNRRREV